MTVAQTRSDLVQMLMLAAGPQRSSAEQLSDIRDFDWTKPCCFTPSQLEKLHTCSQDSAEKISRTLQDMLQVETPLQAAQPQLENLFSLKHTPQGAGKYCLAVSDATGQTCGFVALPAATANQLIARLLGGSSDSGKQRELSNLEADLLLDLLAAAVKAFATGLPSKSRPLLQHQGKITSSDAFTIDLQDGCRFAFAPQGQETPWLEVVLSCQFLETAAGWGGAPRSAEDNRKLLLEHLDRARLAGSVWLGSATLRFRDALAIESGDVLLLPTKMDDPVTFVVQNKTVATGRLANCEGCYALTVTGKAK